MREPGTAEEQSEKGRVKERRETGGEDSRGEKQDKRTCLYFKHLGIFKNPQDRYRSPAVVIFSNGRVLPFSHPVSLGK